MENQPKEKEMQADSVIKDYLTTAADAQDLEELNDVAKAVTRKKRGGK